MRFSQILPFVSALTLSACQTFGNDPPQPPATVGYTISHAGIFSSNLTATKHFYGDVLGMREVVSFTTEILNILFMAYPSHPNQTGEQIWNGWTHRSGTLEFLNPPGKEWSEKPDVRYSHIGLHVSDITATQERIMKFGYGENIVKKTGDDIDVKAAERYFGLRGVNQEELPEVFRQTLALALLVTDPDGVLVEVLLHN